MKLHQRVRNRREAQGITQQKWAEMAKVHRTQVQQFESGANLTLESMEKLLDALGLKLVVVSPDEIRRARQRLAVVELRLVEVRHAGRSVETLLEPLGVAIPALHMEELGRALKELNEADDYLRKIEQDVNPHLAYTETPPAEDEPPSPPRKRASRGRKRT